MSRFYEVGPIGEIAVSLFHGYGYNFYRKENQLRADDQRVRALACELLGKARAAIEKAEGGYRRTHMPPPTREKPFPDSAAVAGAQALERLARAIGGLEGQIRHQPVPENDRMTQRYREEAATLETLAEADKMLIGQSETLRAMLQGVNGEAVLEKVTEVEEGIEAIAATLRKRQMLLV
jgi:hypothetical protein